MSRKQVVKLASDILADLAPDSQRLLYGSEARDEARDDSDIDILVILPDDSKRGSFAKRKIEITERLYDLELQSGITVSPLIVLKSMWNRMRTPFTINVTNDSIAL